MSATAQHAPLFESVTQPVTKVLKTQQYGDLGVVELPSNDLLFQLQLETTLNLTFNQPAGAAAVTPKDPDWPNSAQGPVTLESNVYKVISKMDGRVAKLLKMEQDLGFLDSVSSFNLPGANGGTTTVTSQGTVTAINYVPVSVDAKDLRGIVDLQANGMTTNIGQTWYNASQLAALLNMGTNTITQVTGSMNVVARLLKAPAVATSNLAAYMSQAHRTSYDIKDINGQSSVNYQFLGGPQIRRVGFLFLNGGIRDVGNALALTNVTLKFGNSNDPLDLSERQFRAYMQATQRNFPTPLSMMSEAAQLSLDGWGIYWYDGTDGLYGRDYINTASMTSQSISFNFQFASALPAGAKMVTILDRFEGVQLA